MNASDEDEFEKYRSKLRPWVFQIRQWLWRLGSSETDVLAGLQKGLQCPLGDWYFALTANLGTHVFFMIVLPVLYWTGHPVAFRSLIHVLGWGVYWSGFVKDGLCLPRPLSPPLQRISTSKSTSLEYGFPSTHSTNAVGAAVWLHYALQDPNAAYETHQKWIFEALLLLYVLSIVFGRLYCGMHSFLDVTCGSLLGFALGYAEYHYLQTFDMFFHTSSVMPLVLLVLGTLFLIWLHPEPVDPCPCFDDSVAFAGVLCGIELSLHSAQAYLATAPRQESSLVKGIIRWTIGIMCIIAWRRFSKAALLRSLPLLYRQLEARHIYEPRRHFQSASQYRRVPSQVKLDNVMPNPSDVLYSLDTMTVHHQSPMNNAMMPEQASGVRERQTTAASVEASRPRKTEESSCMDSSQSARARTRYDVEIVTKLIVYAGIAWITMYGAPRLFAKLGIGIPV